MTGMSERVRKLRSETRRKPVVSDRGLERLGKEVEMAWNYLDAYPALSDEDVFLETVKYLLLQKQIYEVRSRRTFDMTERENFESIVARYNQVLDGGSLSQLALNIVYFATANANYLAKKRDASHLARSWRNVCEAVIRLAGEKDWFVNS